jgi:hypothetical protein
MAAGLSVGNKVRANAFSSAISSSVKSVLNSFDTENKSTVSDSAKTAMLASLKAGNVHCGSATWSSTQGANISSKVVATVTSETSADFKTKLTSKLLQDAQNSAEAKKGWQQAAVSASFGDTTESSTTSLQSAFTSDAVQNIISNAVDNFVVKNTQLLQSFDVSVLDIDIDRNCDFLNNQDAILTLQTESLSNQIATAVVSTIVATETAQKEKGEAKATGGSEIGSGAIGGIVAAIVVVLIIVVVGGGVFVFAKMRGGGGKKFDPESFGGF